MCDLILGNGRRRGSGSAVTVVGAGMSRLRTVSEPRNTAESELTGRFTAIRPRHLLFHLKMGDGATLYAMGGDDWVYGLVGEW